MLAKVVNMKKIIVLLFIVLLTLVSCGSSKNSGSTTTSKEDESMELKLYVNNKLIEVAWEDNSSVKALLELTKSKNVIIDMEPYGGFEVVGPIGTSLPSSNKNITTSCGDIMLYANSNIVMFYGSNEWSYTKLGHISNMTDNEIEALLTQSSVRIKITK